MSFGTGILSFTKNNPSGAPFPAGSANNGLSVDPVSGKIVLGNDETGAAGAAQLLNNREIVMNEFIIRLLELSGFENASRLLIELGGLIGSNFGFALGVEGATITKRATLVSEGIVSIDGQADNFGVLQGDIALP